MMKSSARLLLLFAITAVFSLTAVALAGGSEEKAEKKSLGQTLYSKKCAACHGEDGKGVEKMAAMLKTEIHDLTKVAHTKDLAQEWKKLTLEGKGKMPGYKDKFKESELDSLLAYVLGFAKKESEVKEKASGEKTEKDK